MNKRKPDDDVDPNIRSPPPRSKPMCAKCHTSKKVRYVRTVTGEYIPQRHADSCVGKCVVDGCMHWSHGHATPRKGKKKKTASQAEIDAAVVAGFKPHVDEDLKQMWEDELKKAGLAGTSMPGPGALDKVVNVCHKYAMAKVQKLSPTVNLSDASVNSVVRALESHPSTSTSTPSAPALASPSPSPSASASASASMSTSSPIPRYQCTNCSWMHRDPSMNHHKCSMCGVGMCVQARAGAAWSPEIYQAAMDVIEEKKTQTTSTSTTTTTTMSTNTSTSKPAPSQKQDDMTSEPDMDWNDLTFDVDDDDDDDDSVASHIHTNTQTYTNLNINLNINININIINICCCTCKKDYEGCVHTNCTQHGVQAKTKWYHLIRMQEANSTFNPN